MIGFERERERETQSVSPFSGLGLAGLIIILFGLEGKESKQIENERGFGCDIPPSIAGMRWSLFLLPRHEG